MLTVEFLLARALFSISNAFLFDGMTTFKRLVFSPRVAAGLRSSPRVVRLEASLEALEGSKFNSESVLSASREASACSSIARNLSEKIIASPAILTLSFNSFQVIIGVNGIWSFWHSDKIQHTQSHLKEQASPTLGFCVNRPACHCAYLVTMQTEGLLLT